MVAKVIYGPTKDDFVVWATRHDGNAEVLDIQVGSERRKGIGRKMLSELFNQLAPGTVVFAITRADNEIAQQFYEALQFRTANVLRRYYGSDKGVDAVMYLRKAGGPA